MGTYVYALNTKVREISGVKLGVAEFRYKEYGMLFGGEKQNARMYNRTCGRRVAHFENNPQLTPEFFVHELKHGASVRAVKGIVFSDYVRHDHVGMLVKDGRGWKICFDPGYPLPKEPK
jgi:hypothetical protein